MTIQKIATWIPVTNEALADARAMQPWMNAWLEYSLYTDGDVPLTWTERLTGTRLWTASSGYVLHVAVGWRAEVRDVLRSFAREAWPEDYPPDDECEDDW